MPSVSQLDELMKGWAREWTPEPPVGSDCDVFNLLWEASECYYGSNHYNIRPNFERVLGEMTAIASWLSPSPFGNPIIEAINDGALVCGLRWLQNSSDEYSGRKLVLSQHTFLLEKLADYMRTLCRECETRLSAFSGYTEFIRRLRDRFDLGIYNLNYDTIARITWPEAYCGFDCYGTFEPSIISQRPHWGFIYHLHGSVHHCITEFPHRIAWKDNLGDRFVNRLETAPDMAQEFRPTPLTTLVAGGFKQDQLLADPYQTLYSALVRHAQEADAVLIAGYGFGDLHVNRALQNRFERSDDAVQIPQVVVLEKSPNDKLQTASLQSHDYWAYQLTHTLNVRFRITKAHLNRELKVASFVESEQFETDINNRVAIWHGGFQEAITASERICNWMSRTL